jgi:hypothetical protein
VNFRAVILSSDVAMICGVTERTARRKLKEARELFDKRPEHYVTVEEFSFYSGIPVETIHEHFKRLGENGHENE